MGYLLCVSFHMICELSPFATPRKANHFISCTFGVRVRYSRTVAILTSIHFDKMLCLLRCALDYIPRLARTWHLNKDVAQTCVCLGQLVVALFWEGQSNAVYARSVLTFVNGHIVLWKISVGGPQDNSRSSLLQQAIFDVIVCFDLVRSDCLFRVEYNENI